LSVSVAPKTREKGLASSRIARSPIHGYPMTRRGKALFLLGNLLEFCVTRGADQHLSTREPGLDVLPMLRTDEQKTI